MRKGLLDKDGRLLPGWGELTFETQRGGLTTADGLELNEEGLTVTVEEDDDDGRIALWVASQAIKLVAAPKAKSGKGTKGPAPAASEPRPSPASIAEDEKTTEAGRESAKDGK